MTNLLDKPKRRPFEGVDFREAGRKGGYASGVSRRLRHQRELEQRIASTKNGAAIFGLYRTQLERDQELERERIKADRAVMELDELADSLRATIDDLQGECDTLRAEHAALEQRKQAAASVDDDALDTLLAEIGEERATASALRIGWGSDDDEDIDDVA